REVQARELLDGLAVHRLAQHHDIRAYLHVNHRDRRDTGKCQQSDRGKVESRAVSVLEHRPRGQTDQDETEQMSGREGDTHLDRPRQYGETDDEQEEDRLSEAPEWQL